MRMKDKNWLAVTAAGLSSKKNNIALRRSSPNDPHIKKAIDFLITAGVPQAAIDKELAKTKDNLEKYASVAPMMHNDLLANYAESALFDVVQAFPDIEYRRETNGKVSKPTTLNGYWLQWMKQAVMADNLSTSLNPLRDARTRKMVNGGVTVAFVPDEEIYPAKKHAGTNTNTACCNRTALIFVNKGFAQALVNFAWLLEIKPNGKKYRCNAAKDQWADSAPDDLCYIEFLLAHEMLHFAHGDFYINERSAAYHYDHDTINRASDYRSNQMLVNSGYTQLPIGLFSSEINYEKMDFDEMLKAVVEEKKKIEEAGLDPDDAVPNNPDHLEEDEKGEGEGDGQGGEGNGGQQGTQGKKGDKKDQKDQKKGKGGGSEGDEGEDNGDEKDGSGGGKGKDKGKDDKTGSGGEPGDMTKDQFDKVAKDIADNMDNKTDSTAKDIKDAEEAAKKKQEKSSGQPGQGSGGSPTKFPLTGEDKPVDWLKLLKEASRHVRSADVETNRTKMGRRAVSALDIAKQKGMAAVPPRELELFDMKVAIVIDSSGSMGGVIQSVFNAVIHLFSQKTDVQMSKQLLLYKYTTIFEKYEVKLAPGRFDEVKRKSTAQQFDLKSGKKSGVTKTLSDVLLHLNGGTAIPNALVEDLKERMSEHCAVVILSDGDILSGVNAEALQKLFAHPARNLYVILDCADTYKAVMSKFKKWRPRNVTYLFENKKDAR